MTETADPPARVQLAAAHKRWTPEQIAANALEMAELVDLLYSRTNDIRAAATLIGRTAQIENEHLRSMQRSVRMAANLISTDRLIDAIEVINRIAAVEMFEPYTFDPAGLEPMENLEFGVLDDEKEGT